MVNQVLHHLPDAPHDGRPTLRRVLAEFARVLRPDGAAIINTCSHEQLRLGWWFAALVPDAVETMRRRHADTDELNALLAEAGLVSAGPIRAHRCRHAGRCVRRQPRPARPRVATRRFTVVGDLRLGAESRPRPDSRPGRRGNARRLRRRARSHAHCPSGRLDSTIAVREPTKETVGGAPDG